MANWLERRFGGIATKHLYEGYATQRWGLKINQLSNTLARHHFYTEDDGECCAIGGTAQSSYEGLFHKVQKDTVLVEELPTHIEQLGPMKWKINTEKMSYVHEGPLLLSLSPQKIREIFKVSKSVEVDLAVLQFKDLGGLEFIWNSTACKSYKQEMRNNETWKAEGKDTKLPVPQRLKALNKAHKQVLKKFKKDPAFREKFEKASRNINDLAKNLDQDPQKEPRAIAEYKQTIKGILEEAHYKEIKDIFKRYL